MAAPVTTAADISALLIYPRGITKVSCADGTGAALGKSGIRWSDGECGKKQLRLFDAIPASPQVASDSSGFQPSGKEGGGNVRGIGCGIRGESLKEEVIEGQEWGRDPELRSISALFSVVSLNLIHTERRSAPPAAERRCGASLQLTCAAAADCNKPVNKYTHVRATFLI